MSRPLPVGIDVGASHVDEDGTLHIDKKAATKALAEAGISLAKQNNFDIGGGGGGGSPPSFNQGGDTETLVCVSVCLR